MVLSPYIRSHPLINSLFAPDTKHANKKDLKSKYYPINDFVKEFIIYISSFSFLLIILNMAICILHICITKYMHISIKLKEIIKHQMIFLNQM